MDLLNDHVNPITFSVVTTPLLVRESGGVGTSTHVAPFPLVDIIPKP